MSTLDELHWRAESAPMDFDTWVELGVASFEAQGADPSNRMAAHAALRHALALEPASIEQCVRLAEALAALEDLEGTRTALTLGARLEPCRPGCLARLAELALSLGEVQAAETFARKLLSRYPEDGRGAYLQASILRQSGQDGKALACAERAVRLGDTSVPALQVLGDLLDRVGHTERALEVFDRLLAQAPGHIEAVLHRAELLVQNGRGDEALKSVLDTIHNTPHLLRPRIALGVLCRRLGRSELALDYLREAIVIHPRSYQAHLALGLTLESVQRYSEAEQILSLGAQLEAESAELLRSLARVRLRLGRAEDAAGSLSRAAAMYPKDEVIRRELLELMSHFNEGRRASLSGDLRVFDVAQLLETIYQTRLTGRLEIGIEGQVAELDCDEGHLIGGILRPVSHDPGEAPASRPDQPAYEERDGPSTERSLVSFGDVKAVLATILKQSRGMFQFFPDASLRRSLADPIPPQHAMLEVFREQDEGLTPQPLDDL